MALNMTALARWERAAQRALAADLPHQLRQRESAVVVPSKTEDGKTYHVAIAGGVVGQCDCQASLNGKPCAHRAAVAIRLYERETGVRVAAIKTTGAQAMQRYLRAA